MENTPRRESDVNRYLDELDKLSYVLADKLDMVLSPSIPTVSGMEKGIDNPSLLVTRLKNLVAQLRDIDNRINL